MHSFKNMVANMTNEELRQVLIERIIQERSAQEKKIVSIVIFYFLILLSAQFCTQKYFPHIYTGIVFRSIFLAILIITLFASSYYGGIGDSNYIDYIDNNFICLLSIKKNDSYKKSTLQKYNKEYFCRHGNY